MLRYTSGVDWVEVGAGISRKPMRQLAALDEDLVIAHRRLIELTADAHFEDEAGAEVNWREDVLGLSVAQLNWWKSRMWRAAHEEKLSPEA